MNIAIIGTAYPYRGGIANFNERMARELQKEGHNVTIYNFTVQYPDFLFPGKTQYSDDPAPDDLNIIRCINSVNPLNWITAANKIKKSKPDLVLIKFWMPFMGASYGSILRLLKKKTDTKVISIIDNIIPHEKRIGDKQLSSYCIKPIDGFIVMSQSVLNDLKTFNVKQPIILSPHPVYDNFGEVIPRPQALKKLNLSPDYKYLLFFGLIRKYKGLNLLIQAFADQRLRDRNYKLLIAGEYYADKKDYTDLIESLSLEDEVIQTDKFIPDSEVKYYFSVADIVIQPYKSATQSGVTQIAYHFNTPMIVTNVGGLPELCPHGKVGYVVEPEPDQISAAIIDFFNEDRNKFVQGIENEKVKFSWGHFLDNIFKLYNH